MSRSEPDTRAGQAVYNRFTLALYDWYVLGLSNRFIWKCPTRKLLEHYNRHVSANHLDVGVGTGYFLDRCRFPSTKPRLALLDLNPASLSKTAQRVRRYAPEVFWRDIVQPLELSGGPFDSIGVNYLLHCLPGGMREKAVVFEHLGAHLSPGGTLFGATLLQGGVTRGATARKLMRFYNAKGIFCNGQDNLDGLQAALEHNFPRSGIEVVGCAALFWARREATDPADP